MKRPHFVPANTTEKIVYPTSDEIQKDFDKSMAILKEQMRVQSTREDFEGCIVTRGERSQLQEAKQSFDLGFREHYPSFQVSMNRIIAHGEMPQMAAIPKELRVLTWNVWKNQFYQDARYEALLRETLAQKPHIICFQEVTRSFIAQLDKNAQSGGVLQHYHGIHASDSRICASDSKGGRNYGVLVLTHHSLGKPARMQINLQSQMNRWCDVVSWKVGDSQQVTVATVHLESASYNTKRRVQQLGNIFHDLAMVWRFSEAKGASVVLCGDFNFSPEMKAEKRLKQSPFTDVWPQLHGDDPGYTEDTDVNVMRYVQSGCNDKKVRFDRMMLHSPGGQLKAVELSLLGTNPVVTGDEEDVFPSDHFGLHARYATKFRRA